ncbi:IspD/TarI family cytidylyltransferase [Mycolicibacterium celeriflavum]|uniref:IspD/TarI family cytidylyltransferase n=1 Tax=Mycolicibacterium celeriflavum TaxID=1249101 RepID=UPI003CE7B3CE
MTASPGQGLAAVVTLPAAEYAAASLEPLAGRTPLTRVVQACLEAVTDPATVAVGVAVSLADDVRALLARDGLPAVGVAEVGGQASRAQCLAAALEMVVAEPISASMVLVYDVRQPLTPSSLSVRVVESLTHGATVVLPVQPVTDSVKVVDEGGAVTASLDRSTLQIVQFPRGFAAVHLRRLLADSVGGFDEAAEAIRSAAPIVTVDGDAEAVTAELPSDRAFLEAVIAGRR